MHAFRATNKRLLSARVSEFASTLDQQINEPYEVARRQAADDEDIRFWVEDLCVRHHSAAAKRSMALQLEQRDYEVNTTARLAFGQHVPSLDDDSLELGSDDAIRCAVNVLRASADVDDETASRAASASNLGSDTSAEVRHVEVVAERRRAERRERLRVTFPSPMDLDELSTDTTEPDWLIEGFLLSGNQAHVSAPAKTGKSLYGLWVAANCAVGRDPHTWRDCRPIRVCYLDFEMNRDNVKGRLFGGGMEFDPAALSMLSYFQHAPMPALDTEAGGEWIRMLVEVNQPELIVIDTLSRVTEGGENDSDTYRNFFRHTGQFLKASGVALIRLDHEGHGGTKRARGSSAKSDDVDTIWSLSKLDGDGLKLQNGRAPWCGGSRSVTLGFAG